MTSYLKLNVLPYLINKIEVYCAPIYDREELHPILTEYKKLRGVSGILDLAAFIMFAEQQFIEYNRIRETLLHDIEGRTDNMLIPKTNNYYEVTMQKNEFSKVIKLIK